jgi:hypothetical protein
VILRNRRLAVALAMLTTAVAVAGVAAPAQADLPYPLPSGSAYIFSTPNPPQTNTFVTTSNFWSVVGIESPVGANYGLSVFNSAGAQLGYISRLPVSGQQTVAFIGVNNNLGKTPIGTFQATTDVLSGSGDYEMQYANPTHILSNAQPFVDQPMPMGPGQFITIADVYLSAGQKYRFDANFYQHNVPSGDYGAAYLLPENYGAAANDESWPLCSTTVFGCSLQGWTAPDDGWYGLVVVMVGRSSTDEPSVDVDACALVPAGDTC